MTRHLFFCEGEQRTPSFLVICMILLSLACWIALWSSGMDGWWIYGLATPFACLFAAFILDQLGFGHTLAMNVLLFLGFFYAAVVLGPIYLADAWLRRTNKRNCGE